MRSPYRVAGIGLVIAILVLAGVLLWLPPDREVDLVFELAKAAIGAIPVIFISVIVADLVRRRDADKASSAQRSREVEAFRSRAVEAYNQTKAIRRALRGRGLRPDADIQLTAEMLAELDARMDELSAAQLTFEQLKREAAAHGAPFRDATSVQGHLGTIERYLNRVVKEWETDRPSLEPGLPAAGFAGWSYFADFVGGKESERLPDNPKAAFDALEAAVLAEGRPAAE